MNVEVEMVSHQSGGKFYVFVFDSESSETLYRTAGNDDPILARASAIELATSRGWHIVNKDWDR